MLVKTEAACSSLVASLNQPKSAMWISKQIHRSLWIPKWIQDQGLWGHSKLPRASEKSLRVLGLCLSFSTSHSDTGKSQEQGMGGSSPMVGERCEIFTTETGQKLSSFLQQEQTLLLIKVLMQRKWHFEGGDNQTPPPLNTWSSRAWITTEITLS